MPKTSFSGKEKLIAYILSENPEVKIEVADLGILFVDVFPETLRLPSSFYFEEKGSNPRVSEVTNEKNVGNGSKVIRLKIIKKGTAIKK